MNLRDAEAPETIKGKGQLASPCGSVDYKERRMILYKCSDRGADSRMDEIAESSQTNSLFGQGCRQDGQIVVQKVSQRCPDMSIVRQRANGAVR